MKDKKWENISDENKREFWLKIGKLASVKITNKKKPTLSDLAKYFGEYKTLKRRFFKRYFKEK